jgi:hypothetical protein
MHKPSVLLEAIVSTAWRCCVQLDALALLLASECLHAVGAVQLVPIVLQAP